jgi:hypothetical protein
MTTWDEVEQVVRDLEEHQTGKVLELARRLRPGLTLDDILNPHDFPELGDPDWQFEDGMLTGIQSVAAALRLRRREGRSDP